MKTSHLTKICTAALLLSGLTTSPVMAETLDLVPFTFSHHGIIWDGANLYSGKAKITASILNVDGSEPVTIAANTIFDVPVEDGYYSISIDNINPHSLLAANGKLQLQITVNDDELSPIDINSVPYAIVADTAAHAIQAEVANYVECESCIGTQQLDSGSLVGIINNYNEGITNIATGTVGKNHLSSDIKYAGAVDKNGGKALEAKTADRALLADGVSCEGCITGDRISSGTIISDNIGSGQIINSNIGSDAITTDKVKNNTLKGEDLVNGAIDTTQLANDAVQTAKIKNGAVTRAKLGSDVFTPVMYGYVQDKNGALIASGSGNYTVSKDSSASQYTISFNSELADDKYTAIITPAIPRGSVYNCSYGIAKSDAKSVTIQSYSANSSSTSLQKSFCSVSSGVNVPFFFIIIPNTTTKTF